MACGQAQNLVKNGSFEEGPATSTFITVKAGAAVIPQWKVTRENVDYVGPEWPYHPHGKRSVDLNGTAGVGAIMQTLHTTPGESYLLTFDIGGNYGCGGTSRTLRVVAGDKSATFTHKRQGSEHPGKGQRHQLTFTASGTETDLHFQSLTADPNLCGPVVDNISVVSQGNFESSLGQ